MLTPRSLRASTANSIGSSCRTCLQKPLMIMDTASKNEIPCRLDVMPMHSGTDAYAIQISREGIPTALISIPLKHMHTPVEVVSVKDVTRAGRLMAEFIAGLNDETLNKLTLD